MKSYGYEAQTGNFNQNLDEAWKASCSLKLVHHADRDMSKPSIAQFQSRGMRGFKTKLANYYKEQRA